MDTSQLKRPVTLPSQISKDIVRLAAFATTLRRDLAAGRAAASETAAG